LKEKKSEQKNRAQKRKILGSPLWLTLPGVALRKNPFRGTAESAAGIHVVVEIAIEPSSAAR
jgi:hypothetical protein